MFFLNLSLGEFAALFTAVSAGVVALYLLDRSKRRQKVATLKFWKPAQFPTQMNQRRKIQQPLSLLLQILGLVLLLLAISQLKWGSREQNTRDHVLILDTSAWMGARGARGTLLQEAKAQALSWLKNVSGSDRVMLVRADSMATPATRFETNHQIVEAAIRESQPSASALRLDQALQFATQLQKMHSQYGGEIVYAGAGRIAAADGSTDVSAPANLRVLPVNSPSENAGLRRIGLRRPPGDPDVWEIFVSVKNYGKMPRPVQLGLQFAGSPAGNRTMTLAPGAEQEATFTYRTRAGGMVEARLLTGDAFPQDDRLALEIPQQKQLRIEVYTNEPELLRPVLGSNPNVTAVFANPAAYKPDTGADIVVLDRFAPPQAPKGDSLWIEPPAQQSPVAVAATKTAVRLTRWTDDALLGAGLHTKDLELENTLTFRPKSGDIVVAESDGAPIILARPSRPKVLVMGFQPLRTRMKYELATPLLFANAIRWMAPESFRRWQLNGGPVGAVSVKLDNKPDPATVRVLNQEGAAVPFTVDGDAVRFFTVNPGTVRVMTNDREYVYSLTVPEAGDAVWEVPASVRKGVPRRLPGGAASRDLWQWLALAGLAVLFVEWVLYGRHRSRLRAGQASAAPVTELRKAS